MVTVSSGVCGEAGRRAVGASRWERRIVLGLFLFYLIAYILPLGARPILRPDEFRYAEIPREMIASGNWTAPRLVGFRYYEKPALGYQLTAVCFQLLGENAFALRLPSALAVGLTALMLYLLLRRLSDDPLLPPLAVGIYLTCGLVYGVGTFAVMDSQLTAALSWTIGGFLFAWQAASAPRRLAWLFLAGAAAGVAFLLKGFLAFAVPVAVIVPFLLWQKEWKKLFTYPWLPLVAAVAVALPWSLAIARAEPEFWRYFFVEEHLNRFTGSTYDRDPQPFWYFIPVLLGGVLPAGLLAGAAHFGWTRALFRQPLPRYLLCWAAMPFLLFSIASCKLGTYILPCFPPLAALLALGLRHTPRPRRALRRRIVNLTLGSFGWAITAAAALAILGAAFWAVQSKWPPIYAAWNFWPYAAAACLGLWGFGLVRSRRWKFHRQLGFFLLGMAPALFCGLHAVPASLLEERATANGLEAGLRALPVAAGDTVLVNRSVAQPAAWVLKRDDLVIWGKKGEFVHAIDHYPEYADRHIEEDELAAFLAARPPGSCVAILIRDLKRKPLPGDWPVARFVDRHGVVIIRFR